MPIVNGPIVPTIVGRSSSRFAITAKSRILVSWPKFHSTPHNTPDTFRFLIPDDITRGFLRRCRPLLCHLNRLGLYLSNYQRSPFPESPQHSSAACFIQNLNFFSGYTFPHEIIKQHQMTISISLRIQGQLWWILLCNVSISCKK